MAIDDLRGSHVNELMTNQEKNDFPLPNSIKYVVKDDGNCPNCGGDNISWGHCEPEGDTVFRTADCNTCGYDWVERYILAGVEDDPLGRNILAFNLKGIKGYVSLGDDGLILHLDSDPPHISYNIMMLIYPLTRPKF